MNALESLIEPGLVYGLTLGRGGSKGLPGKNIRPLGGHPLIAWSVAAGVLAESVNRVICSTDDEKIAEAASNYGAKVPFRRPGELASDRATDIDVFSHCIQWLVDNEGLLPEFFVQLRPTTPFRQTSWLDDATKILKDNPQASSVRSVAPTPLTPYKMWRCNPSGRLLPAMEVEGIPEAYNMPRQALPKILWHTGQVDVIRTGTLIAGSMTGPHILALHVPFELAIDIDDDVDFQLAELQFAKLMPDNLISYMRER